MQELKNLLSSKQNVVITTHVNPDGDAIGSSIALLNYLIKKGHEVSLIVPNGYPEFLKWMKNDDLIIYRSTIPVGCSRKILIPIIEKITKLKCGKDFYFSFAPERTAEGVALKELKENPQIIGTLDDISYKKTSNFFGEVWYLIKVIVFIYLFFVLIGMSRGY